uniref:GRAM domain-containing protein n=1 Tax=Steinernema glaseri TaxID=37863 RepID=A0A1I8A2D3_9BILA
MSVNTANTPDGAGVLIYNGEMILLYTKVVNLSFAESSAEWFKGKHTGNLYLTSHRIIYVNGRHNEALRSFSMPFHCLRNVKLEQPVFGANYLKGVAISQPGGAWSGEVVWKLSFPKGGCIDFGQALLKAADMAHRFRPYDAPPAYAPPPNNFYSAPPAYYIPQNGVYNGFQAPLNAFPDQPPAGNVFMYEQPPPYGGIGPDHPPYPAGSLNGQQPTSHAPSAPPAYEQAPPLPQKA